MSPLGPVINFGRGGGEDLGEDHIVFREDGGGGGQSSATEYKVGL